MDQHTGRKALITAKGKRTQADPTPQHTPHPHTHPHYPHPQIIHQLKLTTDSGFEQFLTNHLHHICDTFYTKQKSTAQSIKP